LSDKTQFESLPLIQHNIVLNEEDVKLKDEAELKEYKRLDGKFNLEKVKYELPICAIMAGYNNNADFRIELNLNSVFSQNYSNFFVALVNDASDDGSDEVYRKYFAFHNLSSEKFVYIENKVHKTALESIYDLIMNHCSNDSIIFNIDADDELIGTNVFKVFNAEYQRTNGGFLYSSMYKYNQNVFIGFTQTSEHT
jgi:glycosyltransferase involved in cell wall biosynthesis